MPQVRYDADPHGPGIVVPAHRRPARRQVGVATNAARTLDSYLDGDVTSDRL